MALTGYNRTITTNATPTAASGSVSFTVANSAKLTTGLAKVFPQEPGRYDPDNDDVTGAQCVTITGISGSTVTATLGANGTTAQSVVFGYFIKMEVIAVTVGDIFVSPPVTAAGIQAAVDSAHTLYPTGAVVHVPGGQGAILPDNYISPAVLVSYSNIEIEVGLGTTFTAWPDHTVTTPIASPGVVNWTGHGLPVGTAVSFSVTGGGLPTGITAGTTYFIIAGGYTANSFEISATLAGVAINFTGTSTGTQKGSTQHTWFKAQAPILSSGAAGTLTVNAARYDDTFTIGAGVPAGWAEGDILQLQQTAYSAGQADGFFTTKMLSKTATTFTTYENVPTPFTTAKSATAIKLLMVKNVTFRGIKGTGAGNTNDFTVLFGGINVENFRAYDCQGSYFKGGMCAFPIAAYNLHLEDCDGDYSGFDDTLGNQLAAFGCTAVTHLTRINCHADNSPGEGFLDWACAYVNTWNDRAVGNFNRGLEAHNVWAANYHGGVFNSSTNNVGITVNGNSDNVKFHGCVAIGNAFAGFSAIDAGLIPNEVWAIDCTFKGTTRSSGSTADIVISPGATNFHIINCDYDSIYDGGENSLVMPSKALPVGVIYDAIAAQTISATASETTLLSSSFKGPGGILAGDFWVTPRHVRIRITGTFSNNNTDTIRIKVKLGSTIGLDTGAVTPGSALSGVSFEIFCDLNNFSGASGTANIQGLGVFRLRGAGFTDGYVPIANAGNTFDTAVSQTLGVTATYSSNNALNVMVARVASIEVLS